MNLIHDRKFYWENSVIIEQDVFTIICLFNISQDMLRGAEKVQLEKNREKPCKYQMIVTMNLDIGIIKDELIRMALEKNPEKRVKIVAEVNNAIARNFVPVQLKDGLSEGTNIRL